MKTLIRVQDRFGRGMFQSGTYLVGETSPSVYQIKELEDLAERHSNFPSAYEDDIICDFLEEYYPNLGEDYFNGKLEHRFAFKNLSQFESWVFREEVAILKDNDYSVLKITVKESVDSEFQSLFNIADVISTEDITDLFLN